MLKRRTAEAIATTLKLEGQGETIKFDVTYFNRKQSEVIDKVNSGGEVADTILFMVKDWDSEYPLSKEGIVEMEDECPGLIMAIIEGFHKARKFEQAKN